MSTKCLSLLLCGSLLAGIASAAPVFTDTFASGTAADAGYYRFGTTNTTLTADNANGELDFSYATGATNRSGVIKSFTEQTLTVGDSITFSFEINSRTLASGENHAFRWAIGNLGNPSAVTGAPVTADLASATPFSGGTRVFHTFSASTSNTTVGYGGIISGQSSPVVNTSISGYTGFDGPINVAQTGASSVSLTISRTGTDSYSITQTAFGSTDTGTITGAVANANIFNTIAFSFNNAGNYSVSLDNISVSVIPEPSTLGLLGIAFLSVLAFKRRKV